MIFSQPMVMPMPLFEIYSARFTRFVSKSVTLTLLFFSLVALGQGIVTQGGILMPVLAWMFTFLVGLGLTLPFGVATWLIGAPLFYLLRRRMVRTYSDTRATGIAGALIGLLAWTIFLAVFGMDFDVFASGEVSMAVLLAIALIVGAVNGASYETL